MALNISQQLVAYRKANKLTQEDVADEEMSCWTE